MTIIEELKDYCNNRNETLETISNGSLRAFVDQLIQEDRNSEKNLIDLARHFHALDHKEAYIWLTALFGSRGVIPEILKRMPEDSPLSDWKEMPLGTDLNKMPEYTGRFMDALTDTYDEPTYKKILAGNNHLIPREAMLEEKAYYEAAPSLEVYLKERHVRKVAVLQAHLEAGKIWFEQIITREVVEHVTSDQEILSAVAKDGWLYVTKIPFDTKAWLEAETENEKLYYACHCPFVREGLKDGTLKVNKDWCYCSAGFAKYPFEVLFDQELDVELLETPLQGDARCRFRIRIPEGIYGNAY